MAVFGTDVTADQTNWLDGLSHHAIFTPSSSKSNRQCMVVRNSDLILASDKSLRMTSLLEVKHKDHSGGPSSSSSLKSSGTYKELVSDTLDFDIAEVILNPTGKLVAVVGSHKIVIVVLPRPGVYSSKSVGAKVSVKAATVGSFYYHERIGGRARLASVKWHPWGHLGSSLLVMSKDGLLREFDVSSDVQEPVQTISLLPSSPKQHISASSKANSRMRGSLRSRSRSQTPAMHRSARGSSRIALDDDDENSEGDYDDEASFSKTRSSNGPAAVTFTFGIDARNSENDGDGKTTNMADWKPLTLYTLCANGDIYALCPFMPKNASVPFSYISSLSSLAPASSPSSDRLNGDVQNRYLSSLLKQARTSRKAHPPPSSPIQSRRSVSATPMSLDPRASAPVEEDVVEEISNEVVFLQAPSTALVPRQPRPQGPFLLWPAPIELSEDRENVSTDIFFARAEGGQNSIDVLGILGDDGRVDLCLMLEAIEPQWGESLQTTPTRKRIVSSGRYALSDSDEDDDLDVTSSTAEAKPLPTLFVYETIDLGVFSDNASPLHSSVLPHFVLDPLYSDTIYIQHATGAHAIGFGRWTKDLLIAMAMSEEERAIAMERVLHTATPSDVIRVVDSSGSSQETVSNEVIGLCIISDIYLSYSFLALMQSGALVALELGLRVEESQGAEVTFKQTAPFTELQAGPAPYTSLLGDGPSFVPPEPFKTVNGLPYHPRSAIKGRHSSQEIRVTTETLRILATVVSTLRGEMRKIVQGGNVVQSRLELQIKELNRQLLKLNETRNRLDQGRLRQEKLDQRAKRVLEKQGSLVKKSDWLLQKLVENHSPEVSIYEARWFKELERLEEDVGSRTETGEAQGLHARVEKLQYQLEVLRPDLIKMKDKSAKEASEMMGAKQLQNVQNMLAKEAQLLATNRDKISHLQSRMQRHNMY